MRHTSKSDAINKIYELKRKCEVLEKPELKDVCESHYHTITTYINAIYRDAENCDPYLMSVIYLLGVDAGELLHEVRKQFEYGLAKDINDIIVSTVKTIIKDLDKVLKEKCECKLLELNIAE